MSRPSRGIRHVKHVDIEPTKVEKFDSFDNMNLKESLLRGVYNYGFKYPSEIQSLAIVPICNGKDTFVQGHDWKDKTVALVIGILNSIKIEEKTTQALVLSPTMELAVETYNIFCDIGEKMNITIELFRGGTDINVDSERAMKLPQIIVATPGRANNLISKGSLRCENLSILCIDEADKMLGEGFVEHIQEIFQFLNPETQFLLVYETFSAEIYQVMNQFLKDPIKILVKTEKPTLEGIKQFFVNVRESIYKFDCLLDLYGKVDIQKAVIFCNSKETVEFLSGQFKSTKFPASAIHGGMEQSERDRVMKQFRLGHTRALISTDLLVRCTDIQQITLVFNFELPRSTEQYLHRIGSSGRYGRKGVAINICDDQDMQKIRELEETYKTRIEELTEDIQVIVEEANKQFE